MSERTQVEFLLAGLEYNGEPLAGGKIYTHWAGSGAPRPMYLDAELTVEASNPIVLDSQGRANVYASGRYNLLIAKSDDYTIYAWDNIEFGGSFGLESYYGVTGGTASAATINPVPPRRNYVDGMLVRVRLGNNLSAGATLNISSYYAAPIRKADGVTAIEDGELLAGRLVEFEYTAGNASFRVVSGASSILNRDLHLGTTAGTASAATLTPSPAIPILADRLIFSCRISSSLNAAATLNISGLGAKALRLGDNTRAIRALDITSGAFCFFEYVSSTDTFRLIHCSQAKGWSSWNPTYTASSGNWTPVTTNLARWRYTEDDMVHAILIATGTTTSTPIALKATAPVNCHATEWLLSGFGSIPTSCYFADGAATGLGIASWDTASIVQFSKYDFSAFAAGADRQVRASFLYRPA